MYTVAALYQFKQIDNTIGLQGALLGLCHAHQIRGTILLATEGINGTVAGTRSAIDALKSHLVENDFRNLEWKESTALEYPFKRLKILLKKEIVTLGKPEINPAKLAGHYVEPEDWNKLVSDPDVLVLDTRNSYEVEIGTFKNAVDPKTQTFREFPSYVETNLGAAKPKRIAMFCTGGIRCEKASSYMLAQGFETVYHLKGGILKYLKDVPPEQSLFQGACFVFDERRSVGNQ